MKSKYYSQHNLILAFVERFGEIVPAKVQGMSYKGGFFGSETPKRCRELFAEKKLDREWLVSPVTGKNTRFKKYFLRDEN